MRTKTKSSQKGSLPITLIAGAGLLVVVASIGYILFSTGSPPTKYKATQPISPPVTATQDAKMAPITPMPKPATNTVSESDKTTDIEKELNQTTIDTSDTDLQEVDTLIQGL